MLHITGSARRGLSAAVAALALAGAGQVSAAQAAPTFSVVNTPLTTATFGPTPTITLTKPGFATVTLTCSTLKPYGGQTLNWGTPVRGAWAGGGMSGNCLGSNGATYTVSIGSGTPSLTSAGPSFTLNGQGTFTLSGGPVNLGSGQASFPFVMAWTNGSGATASTVTMNNVSLGTTQSITFYQDNWTGKITGRWTVATTSGGLITALP